MGCPHLSRAKTLAPRIAGETIRTMQTESLHLLKDDMIAFVAGNGLRRFTAYVAEDVPSVVFEEEGPDGWKDFVEHAKASGAQFVTMSEVLLEKEDVELLVEQMRAQNFPGEDSPEMEDAQYLVKYVGKVGYLQLGFAHQGVMFLYETATDWYDRYQQWMEAMAELGSIHLDGADDSD